MDAGVFHVQENLMQQERVVAEMETSSLLLNEYHQQLDSVANLSMLLLGFVMVGLCGSELNVIADPQYATCYSKSTAHFVFTLLLLLSTELCVCFCLLCIAGATYAVHVGRHAYLHVGWLVAVYRTQAFVYKVHTWFFLAGCCFLVSLSAYGWKFLGVSLLIDVSDTASEYADDAVVTTQGGATLLVKCLDVTNDAQVRRHHLMGVALASVISIVLLASAVYGIYTIGVSWRRTYVRDQADPELLRLRRKVEVDKLNWRRAQREATRLERACQEANETAPSARYEDDTPDDGPQIDYDTAVHDAQRAAKLARINWEQSENDLALLKSDERGNRQQALRKLLRLEKIAKVQ